MSFPLQSLSEKLLFLIIQGVNFFTQIIKKIKLSLGELFRVQDKNKIKQTRNHSMYI